MKKNGTKVNLTYKITKKEKNKYKNSKIIIINNKLKI